MVVEVEPARAPAIFAKYENGIVSSWMLTGDGKYTALSPFNAVHTPAESAQGELSPKDIAHEEPIYVSFYAVSDGKFAREDAEPLDIVPVGAIYTGMSALDESSAQYQMTGVIERVVIVKNVVVFFVRTKWAEELVIPVFHSNLESGFDKGDKISCAAVLRLVGIERRSEEVRARMRAEIMRENEDEYAKLISKSSPKKTTKPKPKRARKLPVKNTRETQAKRIPRHQSARSAGLHAFEGMSAEDIMSAETSFAKPKESAKHEANEKKRHIYDAGDYL